MFLALMTTGVIGKASANNGELSPHFIYTAKLVCVDQDKRSNFARTNKRFQQRGAPGLVPGVYKTVVNVKNPWDEAFPIMMGVELSSHPRRSEGPRPKPRPRPMVQHIMAPNSAFDEDCFEIKRGPLGEGLGRVLSGTGFLTIVSPLELEVVTIVTQGGRAEASGLRHLRGNEASPVSIDMEYVQPKKGFCHVGLSDPHGTFCIPIDIR